MKFRVVSDLHVEFYAHPLYLQRKLDAMYPDIEEDEILIVAGDLGVAGDGISSFSLNHEYKAMLKYFARKWNYVILVPGNHEYYQRHKSCKLEDVDNMIRKECDNLGIVFLNKSSVVLDLKHSSGSKVSDVPHPSGSFASKPLVSAKPLVLLGCTLWSEATKEAYKGMNDKLKAILNHDELIKTHHEHKEWLDKELKKAKRKNQEVIVVTHHLPLQCLTHPKYLTDRYKDLNSAYASHLDSIIKPMENVKSLISHWFCGHTHERTEKEVYGVSFLINPIGYPRESKVTKTSTEIVKI